MNSQPRWIAKALLGHDQSRRVMNTWARTFRYPTTNGPFGSADSIGASALSWWTITAFVYDDGAVHVYADKRFLGFVDAANADAFFAKHFVPGGPPVTADDMDTPVTR